MCGSRSVQAPPAPVAPPPIVRSQPIEDMAPKIEIAGEDGMDALGKKIKKSAKGTKALNTSLGTGSVTGAGLAIPQ